MSNRKLLLADDSITIQKVVNLTFADEGIEVITVGDGDSAVETIAETRPDIVLADVHMPGLNGYEVCEAVRANPATKDLPVVLLVGSFEPYDAAEAERVGATAYLTKPFHSIRELVSKVFELLDATNDAAIEETPETEDINSLYHQSFSETIEIPFSEKEAAAFDDSGIDDEMIETSYAKAESEPVTFDTVGSDTSEVAAEDAEPIEEEKSFAFVAEPETEEISPESDLDEYVEPEIERFNASDEEAKPETPVSFYSPFDSPAYDDTAANTATAAENTFQPYEPSISELAEADTVRFDELSEEEIDTDPAFELEDDSADNFQPREINPSVSLSGYDFEDINLLELPDTGNSTVDFVTPSENVEAGGSKQVVSLSPELMDAIVRKVVEKLTEKY